MNKQLTCLYCGTPSHSGASYCSTCGKALDTSFTSNTATLIDTTGRLNPGQVLHQRYSIISLLGSGGMGAVYKAHDQQFGNRVIAIKEMSQSRLAPENVSLAIEQFKKEAHLLAGLTHPTSRASMITLRKISVGIW